MFFPLGFYINFFETKLSLEIVSVRNHIDPLESEPCTELLNFLVVVSENYGEMVLEEVNERILVRPFGKAEQTIACTVETEQGGHAHGGGDAMMIASLYEMLTGAKDEATALVQSVESHLMGIKAERSRKRGGKLQKIH